MKSKLLLLTLLGVVGGAVAAGTWRVAQWQAMFDQVPAPPATLAQAGADVGIITDKAGVVSFGLTSPALLKSRANYHAGMDAISQASVDSAAPAAAAGGIDVARLRSDPAYAQQLQQKMASMSQAQKMQMAMQMQASQQQSQQAMLANPTGMRAGLALMSYTVGGEGGQRLGTVETTLRKDFTKLVDDYDARHTALGMKLAAALKACPVLPFSVCHKECGPALGCLADINRQVPGLIAQHRKLAAAELAEERALFAKTRGTMRPVIAKTANLTAAAEAAGTPATQRQAGYTAIANAALNLQLFAAKATLRAGYWQNIQQRTVRDDYFEATSDIGYQYVLARTPQGEDNQREPPADLPKDW